MEEKPINTVDTGLADVPVCTSDISHTTAGKDGLPILLYRGYSIYDLIRGSFEERAYLILNNQLPNKVQLDDFCRLLHDNMPLNREIQDHIKTYPRHAHLMDLTLTAFSFARMWTDYVTTWRMIAETARPRPSADRCRNP
jgi:citrate synthase